MAGKPIHQCENQCPNPQKYKYIFKFSLRADQAPVCPLAFRPQAIARQRDSWAVLWNRNCLLRFRFWFWLLEGYGSGSDSSSSSGLTRSSETRSPTPLPDRSALSRPWPPSTVTCQKKKKKPCTPCSTAFSSSMNRTKPDSPG